jgi:hypothetical protein
MAIMSAMGRNGSGSLVPLLLEAGAGPGGEPGISPPPAAIALGDMAAETALCPALLKEWGDLNRKRFKETAFPETSRTALQTSARIDDGDHLRQPTPNSKTWWAQNAPAVRGIGERGTKNIAVRASRACSSPRGKLR